MTNCSVCAAPFSPQLMGQVVCGVRCAQRTPVIARNTLKAERKETKKRIEAIKPRAKWLAEAQQAFNAWIRLRDEKLGCISCGATTGKMNAGHYLSVGARPELRFDPQNVSKQCERCNTYLHGNLIAYRAELIRRQGQGAVDRLEGHHGPLKLSVDELRAIRDDYRAKTKALTKGANE